MIVVNTETIPGMKIVEQKGLVQGNTVRAKHVGRDIAASFKNFVGGELKGYTELLTESRSEAVARMLAQAEELGANAVVNVRLRRAASRPEPPSSTRTARRSSRCRRRAERWAAFS